MSHTDTISSPAAHAPLFLVEDRLDLGQRCLRILADRPVGAILSSFASSTRVAAPSYLTVQYTEHVHLELTPAFLECVNHSCTPNVSFDMTLLSLVALQPLKADDELTYFYPSTEWTMTQPFKCACGSARCLNVIDGASTLSAAVLESYPLSPLVRQRLAARGH